MFSFKKSKIFTSFSKKGKKLRADIDIFECKPSSDLRRNSIFTKTFDPEQDNEKRLGYVPEEDEILNEDGLHKDFEKTPEIKTKLTGILQSILLFRHLYLDELNLVIANMKQRDCSENEEIITEGEDGDYFYIVERGLYHIYKHTKDSENSDYGKKVGEYEDHGYFGEVALLYNMPRTATVVSLKDNGILWAISRQTFQRLIISSSFKRRKMYTEFLTSVPLLSECMSEYEISQVSDALVSFTFKKGDCVIRKGDIANGMYFIEEGEVEIVRANSSVILGKGKYFGEVGVINRAERSASAFVFSDSCRLAFLELDAFERFMGPCIEMIKDNIKNYTY